MTCDADTGIRSKRLQGKAAKGKRKGKKATLADKADRFRCYQLSVQSPEHEVEFLEQVYREAFGKQPYSLREDFCGTFAVCCEWVKSHKKRTAIGVDLCGETLQWGRDHNLKKLGKGQQRRVTLLQQDVRNRNEPKVDIVAAQNYSFWIFKTRPELTEYFRIARDNLKDQGVLVMDMMGGGDCYIEEHVEKKKVKKGKRGFSYHWEQACYNPVNSHCSFYIHFRFADGSKMKRAFEYHWRFWTIPEVREMLEEAGFRESHVYWELEDEDGEDTGEWARNEEAVSHASWLAYIVAVK
jgi:SAM-dependent methyltransferase